MNVVFAISVVSTLLICQAEQHSSVMLSAAVNGGWSSFGPWGQCSATCGGGTQERSRTCTNPPPSGGGAQCSGDSQETRTCNNGTCNVDGGWSNWSNYSECSVSCGKGKKYKYRTCTNPPPSGEGKDCRGKARKGKKCKLGPCKVDGGWSDWGDWGQCSATCGGGTQERSRNCTNPPPSGGGAQCVGPSKETQACNTHECPVDGGWSDWGDWGQCSATCGGGTQERLRNCTNPPPSGGGAQCVGPSKETQACNTDECPVDGGWSDWGDWGQCSATCGGGTQERSRNCTNPPPSGGGAQCSGDSQETRTCNNGTCNVDGGWSNWSNYSECSVSCGKGKKYKYRTCTNPPPSGEGKDCRGKARKGKKCKLGPCRVNGGWSDWGDWGQCSASCGDGQQARSRTCTNPPPSGGGAQCSGDSQETRTCNNGTCNGN